MTKLKQHSLLLLTCDSIQTIDGSDCNLLVKQAKTFTLHNIFLPSSTYVKLTRGAIGSHSSFVQISKSYDLSWQYSTFSPSLCLTVFDEVNSKDEISNPLQNIDSPLNLWMGYHASGLTNPYDTRPSRSVGFTNRAPWLWCIYADTCCSICGLRPRHPSVRFCLDWFGSPCHFSNWTAAVCNLADLRVLIQFRPLPVVFEILEAGITCVNEGHGKDLLSWRRTVDIGPPTFNLSDVCLPEQVCSEFASRDGTNF